MGSAIEWGCSRCVPTVKLGKPYLAPIEANRLSESCFFILRSVGERQRFRSVLPILTGVLAWNRAQIDAYPTETRGGFVMAADIGTHRPARQIHVLVAIDTARVKSAYEPNEYAAQPQPIAHEGVFILDAGSRARVHHRVRGELRLRAAVGDGVTIRVTSVCGNASDAVISYRIGQAPEGPLFGRFEQTVLTRSGAVRPNPDSPNHNGLPPVEHPTVFSHFNSIVRALGTGNLAIAFALYALSSNGQQQRLFGYYECYPSIFIV